MNFLCSALPPSITLLPEVWATIAASGSAAASLEDGPQEGLLARLAPRTRFRAARTVLVERWPEVARVTQETVDAARSEYSFYAGSVGQPGLLTLQYAEACF